MRYYSEVDGLRAVAVFLVIFFHLGVPVVNGGYIGVDIFFVISGYLITLLIQSEIENKSFKISNFYERRVRRILPALYFMMATTTILALMILPPGDLVSFSKSLISIPIISSNYFFMNSTDYFDANPELKPLLHTWSLAVEEQFYLIFPALLIILVKFRKHIYISVFLILTFASLLLAHFGSTHWINQNFYLLSTRAWEFTIGSLIAFIQLSHFLDKISLKIRELLSLCGALFIVLAVIYFDQATPFPSFYTLVPTTGAALIILFSKEDTTIGKILKKDFLTFMGLLSYSMYLWHQPLIAFSKYLFIKQHLFLKCSIILLTVLLSVFTFFCVEKPFRQKAFLSRSTIFSCAISVSLFFVMFGYLITKIDFKIEDLLALKLNRNIAVYAPNSDMNERTFVRKRIISETIQPASIVIGSSRVMQIDQNILNETILNLGVSGSSVEDDAALLHLSVSKFNPARIFIGADPWLFNSQSGQSRWKAIASDYNEALISVLPADKLNDFLFKANDPVPKNSYISPAIQDIGLGIYAYLNFRSFTSSNCRNEEIPKICRDGSRIYDNKYISKSEEEIISGFDGLVRYSMDPYQYSDASKYIFNEFIRHYSLHHDIILVLSPYHPDLYKRLYNENRNFSLQENEFRILANDFKIKIVGSYDPIKCGCTSDEFFDGMHPKTSCMKKVLSEIMIH